jgi:hypothetical protein
LLSEDAALRSWNPDAHRPALERLVEHLTDYLPDD